MEKEIIFFLVASLVLFVPFSVCAWNDSLNNVDTVVTSQDFTARFIDTLVVSLYGGGGVVGSVGGLIVILIVVGLLIGLINGFRGVFK